MAKVGGGKRRFVAIAIAVAVVVVVIIFVRGYCGAPPPKRGSGLADQLREWLALPASGMTRDLAPGTLLRVGNMGLVARPGEAYRNPRRLESEWQDLIETAHYEDSLEGEGGLQTDILAFLGHAGSSQTLEASRVASVTTEIEGLQRKDVSEVQVNAASLRPELSSAVMSGEGVVVVQTLFKARSMKVTYRDSLGASAAVSLPSAKLPGTLKSSTSRAASGVEEWTDVILGYKALFIAGGPGSSMKPETAEALAAETRAKGYESTAVGNLVLVEVTRQTAPQLSELSRAAVSRDEVEATAAPSEEARRRRRTEMDRFDRRRAEIVKRLPTRDQAERSPIIPRRMPSRPQ